MVQNTAPSSRNLALDNLRVVAMLLGLVTHGVLPYKSTSIGQYPIRDTQRSVIADACYFAVHDFRMQVFFLVAGFAAASLAERRGVAGLAFNRIKRIILPLLLAVPVITPLMHFLFTYHQVDRETGQVGVADGYVNPGVFWSELAPIEWAGPNFHLWFLYYLALCCLPLLLCLTVGRRLIPVQVAIAADETFRWFLGRWWKTPVLAVVCIPVLWTMSDWWIDTPQGWEPQSLIFLYYLGFFLFGAMLGRHRDLLPRFGRHWAAMLAIANFVVLPTMLKLTISGNWIEEESGSRTPAWFVGWKAAAIFVGALYTWLSVEGLIGLFQRHFAGSSRSWRYLAEASYWCYLAGFPVQVALQVWLAPHAMPVVVKFLLVNAATFAVLLASYELVVRHGWIGLLLNGKRPERKKFEEPATVVVEMRVPVPVPEKRRVRLPLPRRKRTAPQ